MKSVFQPTEIAPDDEICQSGKLWIPLFFGVNQNLTCFIKQNPAVQGFVFVLGINDKENYVLLNDLCFIK